MLNYPSTEVHDASVVTPAARACVYRTNRSEAKTLKRITLCTRPSFWLFTENLLYRRGNHIRRAQPRSGHFYRRLSVIWQKVYCKKQTTATYLIASPVLEPNASPLALEPTASCKWEGETRAGGTVCLQCHGGAHAALRLFPMALQLRAVRPLLQVREQPAGAPGLLPRAARQRAAVQVVPGVWQELPVSLNGTRLLRLQHLLDRKRNSSSGSGLLSDLSFAGGKAALRFRPRTRAGSMLVAWVRTAASTGVVVPQPPPN